MLEHFENSDGLGAIFPPMIYTVVALECLGYDPDSPAVQWAWRQLDDLLIEEGDRARLQPCVSPVWDTAIATIALSDAGSPRMSPRSPAPSTGCSSKEVRSPGDWQTRRPGVEPSGWHFQYHNEFYPDIDDTAMVLMALLRSSGRPTSPRSERPSAAAPNWLLAMQNRDGGWAAFDVDIDNEVLTKVPFADHNAMLDPSCADITARVIELLGTLGYRADHPAIARGLDYLWKTQEPEGCWYGRWGVNYIYGTWQVLQGLKAIDFPMNHPALVRAADWLESVQQPCGGWGETCRSYDDPALMGTGTPDRLADRLGGPRADRRRPGLGRGGPPRHRVPARDAVRRRHLGRGPVHRHGLPPGLLSEVSSLPGLLPADGDLALPPGDRSPARPLDARPGLPDPRPAPAARLS